MANIITAGNSTNGGTAISTDTSGTLNIVTGSGSGATAVTVDGSGNVVITGTITASGGVSGGIRSGTAVASTSGTSIDFTSLPTGLKRITVMFNAVSTSGTSPVEIRLGVSGTPETSGYNAFVASVFNTSNTTRGNSSASGFPLFVTVLSAAASNYSGAIVLSLLNSNAWTCQGGIYNPDSGANGFTTGAKTLAGVLNMIRITTVNGTDTFDAGTINILYE